MSFHGTNSNYRAALKWISDMYPSLHSHVLNLGKPEKTSMVPTAAVQHHGEALVASSRSHYFSFIINPQFEKELSELDYAFILSHECFHILLGHLAVWHKYDDKMRFNIATDCIINDWLFNFGIEAENDRGYIYGRNVVGFDTSQSSLAEIYKRIPQEFLDQMAGGQCDGNCDGQPDSSGEVGSGTCNCPQTADDHDTMFGDGEGGIDPNKVRKAIEDFVDGGGFDNLPPIAKDFIHDNNEIVQKMKKDDRPQGGWSPTGFGLTVEEQMAEGVSLKWAELMQTITPDLYNSGYFNTAKKRSFTRPAKKLITVYPRAILPADYLESGGAGRNKDKSDNTFILALDHSGSVSANDKRMFTALAHSIPENRAHVFGCTFSTYYVPYDIHSREQQEVAGGGTDFAAVEQYIQEVVTEELGRYPKAIVVITDGYATFGRTTPTDEQLENNWYWLISGESSETSDARINDLCKDHIFPLETFSK